MRLYRSYGGEVMGDEACERHYTTDEVIEVCSRLNLALTYIPNEGTRYAVGREQVWGKGYDADEALRDWQRTYTQGVK